MTQRQAKPGEDFPGIGVGLVIRRADGKVLMCRRLKAPEQGHWSIVGGKIDMMEHAIDAARREAGEETGLTIGNVDFVGLVEAILPQDNQHWISLIYVTEDFSGTVTLTEPEKHSDLGWYDPGDLPSPLSVFARQALEQLEAA